MRMAMANCLEQTLHIACCNRLREHLVGLLLDQVEQPGASDVLHDKVGEPPIVVRFVVLDDVWVVERVQGRDFFHQTIHIIIAKLILIYNFNGDLEVLVVLVRGEEDSAGVANAENFGRCVNSIVLLELFNALLLASFPKLNVFAALKDDFRVCLLLDFRVCLLLDCVDFTVSYVRDCGENEGRRQRDWMCERAAHLIF